jgi:hypothetical protein
VVLTVATSRPDGLQPGTKFDVVGYTITAGARHQEVRVQRKGVCLSFAPCELAAVPSSSPFRDYKSMSREEFKAKLHEQRVIVRVLTPSAGALSR